MKIDWLQSFRDWSKKKEGGSAEESESEKKKRRRDTKNSWRGWEGKKCSTVTERGDVAESTRHEQESLNSYNLVRKHNVLNEQ